MKITVRILREDGTPIVFVSEELNDRDIVTSIDVGWTEGVYVTEIVSLPVRLAVENAIIERGQQLLRKVLGW